MVVQQETIQHYKGIILQLKVNFKKNGPLFPSCMSPFSLMFLWSSLFFKLRHPTKTKLSLLISNFWTQVPTNIQWALLPCYFSEYSMDNKRAAEIFTASLEKMPACPVFLEKPWAPSR